MENFRFHFRVTWGLSGPPESIPTMPPARAECRRTLSRPCGPLPTLPLASSSQQAGRSPVPAQRAKSLKKLDFLEKPCFPWKILDFLKFRYLCWYRGSFGLSARGGRESVGIGPQGRESVQRHSGQARGIIAINYDDLESPQVTLN